MKHLPQKNTAKKPHQSTLAVRSGSLRTPFGEHSEAIFLTSSFVFGSAQEAADKFADRFVEGEPGYVYSRYDNPSTDMLEMRLAALEGAEASIAFSSGMAAHMALAMTFLKNGDEMVSAYDIFGATYRFYSHWLQRFGIHVRFVDLDDLEAWQNAITPKTKMLYLESPSNPLNRLGNIAAIGKLAKQHGLLFAVDNTFSTSVLQQPITLGADLITYSATKFFDGQGRTIAGAVVGRQTHIDALRSFLRSAGPSLSPFNAWIIFKGLETLSLRVEKQSENALHIAQFLETQAAIEKVIYPYLPSHPQHALAKQQQKAGGSIVTFKVKGGRAQAWQVIDAVSWFSRTANLGDTRSTITHPATTTHGRLSDTERQTAGITENLIRLTIGLEAPEDLIHDLQFALSQVNF